MEKGFNVSDVRVRFAPSPTGYLHVGGARTALYNYLYAKNQGGKFILRVEDTDQARSTDEALKMQIGDLDWLGLHWDEGPDAKTLEPIGEFGPYRQSERKAIYRKYADKLLDQGKAYYCFLTDAEIEAQREEALKNSKPLQINSPYRTMNPDEAKRKLDAGESATVRFKVENLRPEYVFKDLVRGEVRFPGDMVSDFVILRSGGMPVYNFCCAIDDALMKITHVFRAEEHLNNSLRQIMIYEALGFEPPQFGHLSIILGEDKQKLSKRHGATSVNEYRQKGFDRQGLINYISLLGWSHPEEKDIFDLQELVGKFSVKRLKSSPAVFDETKCRWVNSQHIRKMSDDDLWSEISQRLSDAGLDVPTDKAWQAMTLQTFRVRMETFDEAVELYRPLLEFQIAPESQELFTWPETAGVIQGWKQELEEFGDDFLSEEQFDSIQNAVKQKCKVKGKQLFAPIRVAIIGKPQGADLKSLVPMLSKQELIKRADIAIQAMGKK